MNPYGNMFGYPEFDENGVREITTRGGDYRDMLMDLYAYRMKAGDTRVFLSDTDEIALLLISGEVRFTWEGRTERASRESPFVPDIHVLHVCKGVKVTVEALSDCEIQFQATGNDKTFPSKYYTPAEVRHDTFGQNLCGGVCVRDCYTVFDYGNAPYSNMVLGEVVMRQGSWSGILPHHHAQPEVYYYHTDKPQGFGAAFVGDHVFMIKDGSFSAIPGGLMHPQVSAPGYKVWYSWMIRHLDGNPWTDRVELPEHLWMAGASF